VKANILKSGPESERRLNHRYEMALDTQYVVSLGNALRMGYGRTRDISSHSVLFTADDALPEDTYISLSLDWPARAGAPMWLVVSGRVFRCDHRGVVVLFRRYVLTPQLNVLEPKLRLFVQFRMQEALTRHQAENPAPLIHAACAGSAEQIEADVPDDRE
jgi:hypothetical protein